MRRRLGAAAVAAGLLALAGAGGRAAPVASAELHHAAVVIDTADGKVRKFCLAFPEESISGAEALRRIEADPVFSSYAGKGQAVCSLCGVGCPAGDCFCDRSKYWAYHRAGPGGAPYKFSSAGVSSTVVRDGDVEGWRWGSGEAPPPATVGEVCDVPEPPARSASSGSGSGGATTTSTSAPSPPPADAPSTTDAAASPAPPPAAAAPRPTAPGPTVVPPTAGAPTAPSAAEEPPVAAPAAEEATTATTEGAEGAATPHVEGRRQLASDPTVSRRTADGRDAGGPLGLAVFVAVLAAVLVWRARLRRANVRS